MSKVSKLVIKACRDNKFSSFTGEFITSINPENLVIKSAVSYYVPQGITSSSLLKYRGCLPERLSFSLLFDNTGIMPGSNTIPVMEQIKQLKDVAYNNQKQNNAPNYIRVIWGDTDFKGRLESLEVTYDKRQVDGKVIRAEAHIAVLEELVPVGKGKSAAGVDSDYEKASGASATSNRKMQPGQGQGGDAPPSYEQSLGAPSSPYEAVGPPPPYQESFSATPNGMNGAYSGAPPGAYNGGPDDIYHGSNGAGGAVYASSVGTSSSGRSASYSASHGVDHSSSGLKGGVAGNGPGGSGGGIGGGGHGPGGGAGKPGGAAPVGAGGPAGRSATAGSSPGAKSGPSGSTKNSVAPGSGSIEGKTNSRFAGVAAGSAAAAATAAAAANGSDSLRKLKANVNLMQKMKDKVSFWRRLKNFAKKTSPKAYDAVKKVVKKI